MVKSLLVFTIFISGQFAFSATKAQINAALGASNIPNITSISETSEQPRCFGCRVLKVEGTTPVGQAYQVIQVTQTGADSFSTEILEQSK